MSSKFSLLANAMPTFTKKDTVEAKVDALADYQVQLLEYLRYALSNLDEDNFNEQGLLQIMEPVLVEIKNVDGKCTALSITAEGIRTEVNAKLEKQSETMEERLDAQDEEISGVTTRVEELSSSFEQTVEGFKTEVNAQISEQNETITQTFAAQDKAISDSLAEQDEEIAAIGSQITSVSTRVENLSSQVSQTAEAIRTEVSAQITEQNQTIETYFDAMYQGVGNAFNAQDAEIDAKFTEQNTRITNSLSTFEQTATQFQTTVNTQITQQNTKISGLDGDITSLENKVSNQQSQITQTSNKIAAVVSAVDDSSGNVTAASIVAAINGAGSTVMIKADKIQMTGTTTFLSAADVGAYGSTVIDGGRIQSGIISGVVLESPGSRWWEDVSIHDGMVDFYSGYIMDSDAGTLVMYAQNYLNFETGGVVRFYMPNGRYWELDGTGMNYYTSSGGFINGFAFAN